ncbi:PIF1-like helicase [Hirsutella rhossiliensis]
MQSLYSLCGCLMRSPNSLLQPQNSLQAAFLSSLSQTCFATLLEAVMAERISFPMETFGLGVPQSRLSCSYKRTFTKHGEWEKCLVLLLQRLAARGLADDPLDGSIVVEEAGLRSSHVKAYQHRGELLLGLYLYDYVSLVGERPLSRMGDRQEDVGFSRPPSAFKYLSRDFAHDDEDSCHRGIVRKPRAAACANFFVPWEFFLCEEMGDINSIRARARKALAPRIGCLINNPRTQNATPSDGHPPPEMAIRRSDTWGRTMRAQNLHIGNATRLIDMAAKSPELMAMMQQLCRFQQSVLCSTAELEPAVVTRTSSYAAPTTCLKVNFSKCSASYSQQLKRDSLMVVGTPIVFSHDAVPWVPPAGFEPTLLRRRGSRRTRTWGETDKAIKSQQMSASKERERMIHGIPLQDITVVREGDRRAAALHRGERRRGGNASPIWPISPFLGDGQRSIAFSIICHQFCQFVGGFEGGTGESQIIEAFVELFSRWSLSNRTAAARINSINPLQVLQRPRGGREHGQGSSFRMDWQENDALVIAENLMVKPRDWRSGWHDRITNCCRDDNATRRQFTFWLQ